MRKTTLPIHPTTGLRALGFSKRGPIWPVLGGDGNGDGNTGDGDDDGGSGTGDDGKKPVIKGKAGEKTGDDGNGDEGKTPPPPPKVTETAEFKAEKKRADDLQAALDAKIAEGMTDDEKARAAETKTAVDTAVSAKVVELTDHYETRISALQGQIVDATIDAALGRVNRKRDEFKTVLETLDKQRFLGEDGAVKTDAVAKWASELAGSSSSKPPRSTSSSSGSDRGFGRYLNSNK